MTECPSCRMIYERRPRLCENCGHVFASDPEADNRPRKMLSLADLGWLSALVIVVVLLVIDRVSSYHASTSDARTVTPAVSSASPERASVGSTVGIVEGKGFWPCGSSLEAYDELMKWAGRGDDSEVKRTLVRTRSIGLTSGLRVKILDV